MRPCGAKARQACYPTLAQADQNTIVFYADHVFYNRTLKIWKFSGHVTVQNDTQYIRAQEITYHEQTALLTATGDVRLKEQGQDCLVADYVEVTGNVKKMVLKKIRFLTQDKSRFAGASAAYDKDDDLIVIENGVYTPCQPSATDPEAPPFWQIKARRIEKRKKKAEVRYIDPQLELLNVPIFYFPYLSFYTKRSSGFLRPRYGNSSYLGYFVSVPYFLTFEHADVKIFPFVTTKRGGIAGFQYRQKGRTSYLETAGSLNASKPVSYYKDNQEEHISSPRGSLSINLTQEINDQWRIKAVGQGVSDKTYPRSIAELRLPDSMSTAPFLESKVEGERFSERDYLHISTNAYQGLYDVDKKNVSLMLPTATYTITSDPIDSGDSFTLHLHTSAIKNFEKNNYERMIAMGEWKRSHIAPWGQVISPFASLRGDFYRSQDISHQTKSAYKNTFRGFPQCGLQTSWPFAMNNAPAIIEPFFHAILAPYIDKVEAIPVGDSQGFEYNDAVLLRKNRSPGYDRIDSGSRFVYGSHFLMNAPSINDIHIFLGQTYMPSTPNLVMREGGLQKGFSNIVGSLMASPCSWLSADYRFSVNKETFQPHFSELIGHIGDDWMRLTLGYTKLKFIGQTLYLGKQEAAEVTLSSHFHENWGGKVETHYDIARHKLLNARVDLVYQNDCFKIHIHIGRTQYHSKDIKPKRYWGISLGFKNFGSGLSTISHDLKKHNSPVGTMLSSQKTLDDGARGRMSTSP
ncbi:LPS-assembly protein LptD [bacterium NHP-B]|nr:LPS-assembly protein LptD [bacterium NHP-B]